MINKSINLLYKYCVLLLCLCFCATICFGQTPVIQNPSTASFIAGINSNYYISASNTPTTYSAAGLPSGLTLNSTTGVISGTPTISGAFTVTLGATKPIYGTGSENVIFSIFPVITSANSFSTGVNAAFSFTVVATSSTTAYTYSATGLPVGVNINSSTGIISGTPTIANNYGIIITATNSVGTATQSFSLSVIPCPSSVSVNSNCILTGFSGTLTASPAACPSCSYSWTKSGGGTLSNASSNPATFTSNGVAATVIATYTNGGCIVSSPATIVSLVPPEAAVITPICTTATTGSIPITITNSASGELYDITYFNVGASGCTNFLIGGNNLGTSGSGVINIPINTSMVTPGAQETGYYKVVPAACPSTAVFTTIQPTITPSVVAIASSNSCLSSGQSSTLTASPGVCIGCSYTWTKTGGGTLSSSTGNPITFTAGTTASSVIATLNTQGGCTVVSPALALNTIPTGGYTISGPAIYCMETPYPNYVVTGSSSTDNIIWTTAADATANANFYAVGNSVSLGCSNCLTTSLIGSAAIGQDEFVNGIPLNLGGSVYDLNATVNGCVVPTKQIILGTPNPKVTANYTTHFYTFTPTFGVNQWSWIADGTTSSTVGDVMVGSPPYLSTNTNLTYTADNSPVFLLNYNTCGYSGENENGDRPEFVTTDSLINKAAISPNPANSIININSSASIDAIIIYDISGARKKYITYSQVQKAILDVADLANGAYLVEIVNGVNEETHKIVVQH